MTMSQSRVWLIGVFLVFFIVQGIGFLWIMNTFWEDELISLLLKLFAVYSVHFGIIFGVIFAQPRAQEQPVAGGIFWVAMALVFTWNLLLSWRSMYFVFANKDKVSDLLAYLDKIGGTSSFLVSGALAFFFTKGSRSSGKASGSSGKVSGSSGKGSGSSPARKKQDGTPSNLSAIDQSADSDPQN